MSDYKNILVITLGGSPSIVTETIWALAKAENSFITHELHLVTTSTFIKVHEEKLLGEKWQNR